MKTQTIVCKIFGTPKRNPGPPPPHYQCWSDSVQVTYITQLVGLVQLQDLSHPTTLILGRRGGSGGGGIEIEIWVLAQVSLNPPITQL